MMNNELTDNIENLDLRKIYFLKSAPNLAQSPPDHGCEVAFVGRSNAGKSSALNTICGQNHLARTSKTPGRTQLINYFALDDQKRLVDLPGLGFAKVPERTQKQIENLLSEYLYERQSLKRLVLLMDIRHPLLPPDRDLLDLAEQLSLPTLILLTKCDKLKRGPANHTLLKLKQRLGVYRTPIDVQTFSSLKGIGVDSARQTICDVFHDENQE